MFHYDSIFSFSLYFFWFLVYVSVSLLLRCLIVYDVYLLCEFYLLSWKIFIFASFKINKLKNKLQRYIVQHKEYSHYFINWVYIFYRWNLTFNGNGDFLGSPVVKSLFPLLGRWVWSLVRKERSHMPPGVANK